VWENCGLTEATYDEDVRDPSAFFATFETGDNTVVTVETGTVPLDMYYSRASNFGDDWDEQDICATDPEDSWYPSASVVCEEGEVELRWDWLENGDDLATEASVYGNPSGDRFYAVWNQELPTGEVDDHGEEVYTNMDTEFRRIFYNLDADAIPSATIYHVSSYALDISQGDELTLMGSGRDFDRMGEGIVEFSWISSIDGVLGTDSTLIIPASSLSTGINTISFTARDNEGNWAPNKSVRILVAEELYQVFLPIGSNE
jgi:hypothetical protein